MKKVTQSQIHNFVREKLKTDSKWAIKALLMVYENQTTDEQQSENTKYYNNIGFNGSDAPFLTSLAKFYKRNNYLSDKQMHCLHKRIHKYHSQIVAISNMEKLKAQTLASL